MNMTELISFFQLEYPNLVRDMKKSDHHLRFIDAKDIRKDLEILELTHPENLNPYHLESDIFTHTMMVCKQAENASYEVQIAALLHDIGKPSTRKVNPKNGRVSFFNHDAVSAFMSLEILNREELGLTKYKKALIFNMIALHTQIYKLSVEQLANIKDPTLLKGLIQLGKADHAGRFHTKGDATIPEYKDLPFIDTPSKKKTKEVVILCGLPGSGKSTWWRNRLNGETCQIISRDIIIEDIGEGSDYNEKWKNVDQKEVDRTLQKMFNFNKTKEGKHVTDKVIVDMTHMSKKSRKKSLAHFGSEYKKKCVVFLPDLPTNFLQNEQREGKVIDKRVIERMIRSFYPPSFEYFDEIEYVI